ncbi:MAG TPA: DEAD/DEAH box helicase [Symbiobacteriaceae bacterium]|nr:DEAD/DEAH box helicase [Symbiobacteriaceae bacterium]
MSLILSGTLGLPPAPPIFEGLSLGNSLGSELGFPSFDFAAPQNGPPPDPNTLYSPEGAEVYSYQQDGVDFLMKTPTALLGDEMGLGKSIQAIAALRLLIHQGEVERALILCPKTIVFDWLYKFRTWAPDIRVVPVEGPKRRRTWYWRCKVHVFLIGYETWREDLKEKLVDPSEFDLVILDEVQRIKNPETAIYQAVSTLQPKRRWGLSGTPLENKLEEMVGIFSYLVPGLFPHTKVAPHKRAVQEAVRPFLMRRSKLEVLKHLPPKETRVEWLDLTHFQKKTWERAWDDAYKTFRGAARSERRGIAAKHFPILKQICNMDPASGASCKMDYLERTLPEFLKQGDKALVFSQYPNKTLKPLMPRLRNLQAMIFDGALSDWNRTVLMHHFQKGDIPAVLAMSLKAGGVGLTLTRANHVYHFDSWWNPAVAEQAEDRVHRIGQSKPVFVTTLLTRNTIEDKIHAILSEKRELFHEVLDPLSDMEMAEEPPDFTKQLSTKDWMRVFEME